jgi:hypothetical protein
MKIGRLSGSQGSPGVGSIFEPSAALGIVPQAAICRQSVNANIKTDKRMKESGIAVPLFF